MCKGVRVHFADVISFFSLRPNYFIFIGYLKTAGEEGCSRVPPEPPLDPPQNNCVYVLFSDSQNVICFLLFVLMLYVPVNNFSVISGRFPVVFLGLTNIWWSCSRTLLG